MKTSWRTLITVARNRPTIWTIATAMIVGAVQISLILWAYFSTGHILRLILLIVAIPTVFLVVNQIIAYRAETPSRLATRTFKFCLDRLLGDQDHVAIRTNTGLYQINNVPGIVLRVAYMDDEGSSQLNVAAKSQIVVKLWELRKPYNHTLQLITTGKVQESKDGSVTVVMIRKFGLPSFNDAAFGNESIIIAHPDELAAVTGELEQARVLADGDEDPLA